MKRILTLAALLLTLTTLTIPATAESENLQEAPDDFGQNQLVEALPDDVRDMLQEHEITPDNGGSLGISPLSVLQGLWELFAAEVTRPLKMLAALTGVILLSAIAESLGADMNASGSGTSKTVSDTFGIIGILAGAGMMLVYISDIVARSLETLRSGSVFLLTFVPVFAGIMAVCGQLTTASVFSGSLIIAGQVFIYISTMFLAPLVSCILGISTAGAVNPDLNIERLSEVVKKIVIWLLGILITIFIGLMSLQSFVSTAADTVALRAMKFTVSNSVPIVGSAVSDALATVRGSLGLLRGSVGTFGIIAGLMVILPAMMSVICHKFALQIAAAVCEIFGVKRLSGLLKSGENVMSIIFAMLFCFALILVVSVALMLIIWNKE
ncbi:MAG: stage III sporulation protein AE [Oscillospiraceae bacterium]|nr:stage III sporulation protein AE [Oscillospiraceae bacterium]